MAQGFHPKSKPKTPFGYGTDWIHVWAHTCEPEYPHMQKERPRKRACRMHETAAPMRSKIAHTHTHASTTCAQKETNADQASHMSQERTCVCMPSQPCAGAHMHEKPCLMQQTHAICRRACQMHVDNLSASFESDLDSFCFSFLLSNSIADS